MAKTPTQVEYDHYHSGLVQGGLPKYIEQKGNEVRDEFFRETGRGALTVLGSSFGKGALAMGAAIIAGAALLMGGLAASGSVDLMKEIAPQVFQAAGKVGFLEGALGGLKMGLSFLFSPLGLATVSASGIVNAVQAWKHDGAEVNEAMEKAQQRSALKEMAIQQELAKAQAPAVSQPAAAPMPRVTPPQPEAAPAPKPRAEPPVNVNIAPVTVTPAPKVEVKTQHVATSAPAPQAAAFATAGTDKAPASAGVASSSASVTAQASAHSHVSTDASAHSHTGTEQTNFRERFPKKAPVVNFEKTELARRQSPDGDLGIERIV